MHARSIDYRHILYTDRKHARHRLHWFQRQPSLEISSTGFLIKTCLPISTSNVNLNCVDPGQQRGGAKTRPWIPFVSSLGVWPSLKFADTKGTHICQVQHMLRKVCPEFDKRTGPTNHECRLSAMKIVKCMTTSLPSA